MKNDVQRQYYQQTQEVFFSRKTVKPFHPPVIFDEVPAERSNFKENLDLHLQFFARHLGLIYDR